MGDSHVLTFFFLVTTHFHFQIGIHFLALRSYSILIHLSPFHHHSPLAPSSLMTSTPPNVPQDHLGASPIIYGTSAFAALYNPIEAHWPAEACRRAIDLGINTFDTSPYYGNSENILGEAILSIKETHPRSTYYLSTKIGRYGPKKADFDYSAARVRASVTESMRRMHTDYLDIVYAHDVEFVSVDRAVEAVTELFKLKVIKNRDSIRGLRAK